MYVDVIYVENRPVLKKSRVGQELYQRPSYILRIGTETK